MRTWGRGGVDIKCHRKFRGNARVSSVGITDEVLRYALQENHNAHNFVVRETGHRFSLFSLSLFLVPKCYRDEQSYRHLRGCCS